MAKEEKPPVKVDPEEQKAEKHVVEIMGPPELLDGSKPVPPAPEESQQSEEPEEPAQEQIEETAAVDVQNVPDSDVLPLEEDTVAVTGTLPAFQEADDALARPPQIQSDGIKAESDLDMEQLPSDFTASAVPDDAETAAAVDDILKKDSDAVLASVPSAPPQKAIVMRPSVFERFKNGWYSWWYSPWKRYGTLGVVVLLLALMFLVAPVRAFVLNAAGVRSSVLVQAIDKSTSLPLQNVVVKVDGQSGKTNSDGQVKLKGIRLGKHDVTLSKIAFADAQKKQVEFGMRIVDLGEVALKPTGQQVTYNFTDYLSGKPIRDAVVVSGEATAKSDKTGKAILTIEPGSTEKITIKKDGYRTETLDTLGSEQAKIAQKLVPAARAIFISKESGKYDVYKMYVDGKDREVLLPGTGLETQAMVALPKPDGEKVAVASSRDDKRNQDGYLLTGLNIVDTESGDIVNIEYAEQITLLGWRGDTLLYAQTVAGASAANPSRQKIIAYNFTTNKRFQLANANYFAGYQLIGEAVYYTVSSTDPETQSVFARVSMDGTGKKTLFTGSIWALLRTDYSKMKIQTPDKWYEYTLGASAPVESTPATDYTSRFYADSPKQAVAAWVDVRDNNGVMLLHSLSDGKDTELMSQKSMQAPSYWLNSTTLVYRVSGSAEVADYVVSTEGGSAKKLADVSLTSTH